MLQCRLLSLIGLLTIGRAVSAQEVRAVAGNVVIVQAAGASPRQLTNSGHDSDPVLSPDGRLVAFVRTDSSRQIEVGVGPVPATDIWVIRPVGGRLRRVVSAHASDDLRKVRAGVGSLAFSRDGHTLYFISLAWVVVGALHAVDLPSGRERFVCDANSVEIVRAGRYAGKLLVTQHRYYERGGSYDGVFLVDVNGQQLRTIGDPDAADYQARLRAVLEAPAPARRRVAHPSN